MLDHQFSTRKEIWEAKKLMYEGDQNTKNSFNIVLITFIALLALLVISFAGTIDSWDCTLDDSSISTLLEYILSLNCPLHSENKYVCSEVRRTINCKTVTGPITGKVSLKLANSVTATAEVSKYKMTCPWETAVSELRVCFIFMALICTVIAFIALKKEDKKYAEIHVTAALFLSVLLAIAGLFDYFSINNSITNNYNYCNLKDDFQIDANTKGEVECAFKFFYTTVVIELFCSVSIFLSGVYINRWSNALTKKSSI